MTTPVSKTWIPQTLMCAKCKALVSSRWPGDYKTCSCGSIAVDQTEHYMRLIGDPENFLDPE